MILHKGQHEVAQRFAEKPMLLVVTPRQWGKDVLISEIIMSLEGSFCLIHSNFRAQNNFKRRFDLRATHITVDSAVRKLGYFDYTIWNEPAITNNFMGEQLKKNIQHSKALFIGTPVYDTKDEPNWFRLFYEAMPEESKMHFGGVYH